MLIRAEQMIVFENTAEENFERRLAAHLVENYPTAIVRTPETESEVSRLPAEILHSLIKISIERARRYEITFESSISAFSAVMFAVSPNFDQHRLSQVMLNDTTVEPNARLDELLDVLTEKNWETIRADYDINEWQARTEISEDSENAEKSGDAKSAGFAATVMNIDQPAKEKDQVDIDGISFDGTIGNFGNAEKVEKDGQAAELDLQNTILNINFSKE